MSACPRCGTAAPTVLVGLQAYCTACGTPRSPLSTSHVNVAGKPMLIGGSIVRFAGCGLLLGGLGAAAVFAAVLHALFPASAAWWIVALVVAGATSPFGFGLMFGGKKIQEGGQEAQDAARVQAVVAMAQARGGAVTLPEVAQAARMTEVEAQALLDRLVRHGAGDAKTRARALDGPSTEPLLRLEVDDDGTLFYALPGPIRRGNWAAGGALGDRTRGPAAVRFDDASRSDLGRDARAEAEAEAEADAERARRAR